MLAQDSCPTIRIPGTTSHALARRAGHSGGVTLRCLKAGSGAPLVLLHAVLTQASTSATSFR